jgi:phospholipid/cholesterol/gamma-HCH transport system ATP-binding protein
MMEAIDIEFKDVNKTFPGSPTATLEGFSLSCRAKAIHTLIGHSGSGKSVTIKHVLGLMNPDAGDIRIKGESILNRSARDLRRIRMNFGMLFQNSALFDSLTVFENVAFPLREHRADYSEEKIAQRVHELLDRVNLAGIGQKMPSQISGGMQKRVGLARSIALDPQILLFDEPTTGLDPMTSKVIDDLIVKTTRDLGASSLIISHDIHAALRISDFVSMIWKGKIIHTATPKDFVKSDNEVVQRFLASAGVQ